MEVTFTHKRAERARADLRPLLAAWLTRFSELEGFKEWKNKQIFRTLLVGLGGDDDESNPTDYEPPEHIIREHKLVTGYHGVEAAYLAVLQVEYYFRRYPFHGLPVSKKDHLQACCELYFSRVAFFVQSWIKLVKRLDRIDKKHPLPVAALEGEIRSRFKDLSDRRNEVHHEEPYDDLLIQAVGLADLLSTPLPDAGWQLQAQSKTAYRRIAREWVARVQLLKPQLELFLGLLAELMMLRCKFLREQG